MKYYFYSIKHFFLNSPSMTDLNLDRTLTNYSVKAFTSDIASQMDPKSNNYVVSYSNFYIICIILLIGNKALSNSL